MNNRKSDGFQSNKAGEPQAFGLYDPRNDRDSCGIGFIANLDAQPAHSLVEKGVRILASLEHRCAIGADGKTSDGAGLMLQLPDAFFRKTVPFALPPFGEYAVGQLFLPTDPRDAETCLRLFRETAERQGCRFLGDRDVPVDESCMGRLAARSAPAFKQVFVASSFANESDFVRRLYVIRREVEKAVKAVANADMSQFYVCSLSPRTIVYKGLVAGSQLSAFYRDLQDADFAVAFCIAHSRYSTNTLPTWRMAQPFRYVAHNGEINTLRGNVNHIRAMEPAFASDAFGADIEKLKPVVDETGSDTMIFDNVLELLVSAGRSVPHAMMMMVPEAFGDKFVMSEDKRAFYEYHAALMEPWDGPAAMVFTDGKTYIGGLLDRNGLRPCRYTITKDGCVIMASETGVIDIAPENVRQQGKLTPGKMFLVDLRQHRVVSDSEIKGKISRQSPYRHWVRDNRMQLHNLYAPQSENAVDAGTLLKTQNEFGYTDEELKLIINPMASNAQEPVGSMGFDAPLAVLSHRAQLLFNYFKQQFAQVTNPPIDPLREELVMSLMSFLGREHNLLTETAGHFRRLKLSSPLLDADSLAHLEHIANDDVKSVRLSAVFDVERGGEGLKDALNRLIADAEKAIESGADILILSDLGFDAERAPIPSLLAVSGLHHALIRKGLRHKAGIVIETGEAREVIHFAQLIAFGANAVCPVTALQTVRVMAETAALEKNKSPEEAVSAYMTALKKGLLKCFSRVGISTVRSFWGSQVFEAVGLGKELIDEYFTGTSSAIGGIGLDDIAAESAARHARAFEIPEQPLDIGGFYRLQRGGEEHLWTPQAAMKLRKAVRENSYALYKEYSSMIDDREPLTLRHLLRFKETSPVDINTVEPVENIMKRFVSAAMSMGSINRETHETIAIAMNRIGGRSNSGEGGEDPYRFHERPNGDDLCSKIKQIASGRFGVTTEYLVNAEELQIKLAQGAKPGEGGQLPAHKVTEEIARIRHTVSGVSLISPPPHHDIYSIEDLAQLIFDLKTVNPTAKVSCKLVAKAGVGTIAAGVAKAKADIAIIAGYDGGTGASPMTAIRHAGLPWELGLAETQQALIANGLRDRIRIQTDGQLKTGRDLAIAALLGAEEYGFGTALLIALGCCMDRRCHLDTCPMGLATQNPELRARFEGKPEHIIAFLHFIAQEMREYMARLGFKTVDDMIGHAELLEMNPAYDTGKIAGIDFSKLLAVPPAGVVRHCVKPQEKEKEHFDESLIPMIETTLKTGLKTTFALPVRNINRAVGTRLSGEIVKRFGAKGLPDESITLDLTGSAGQSLGAFLAHGVTVRVNGDANDYVGKGLSGGRIIVRCPQNAGFSARENVIIGNVALYGATGGEAYFGGMAGERFAVRNSGATAVVEGVGDHCCEYMTGGTVVILGSTGYNFAAGMSGGIAYVYDETEIFQTRCNLDSVDLENVWTKDDKEALRVLLEKHYMYTGSARAKEILDNRENRFPLFVKVVPVEYRKVLDRMKRSEGRNAEAISATEEVYV